MGRFTQILNRNTPRLGRMITEAGSIINVANVARRFNDAFDPFGGLTVAQYEPVFSIHPVEISVINDRVFTTGDAVVELSGKEYRLYNPGGETCRLLTGQRGVYQSGITGVPGVGFRRTTAPDGTTVYRWGYFDEDDGFGFEETENGMRTFFRRNGVIEQTTDRKDWLDPLDGTGPSGRSIDIMDGQIYRLPFSWYAYGTLTIGIIVDDAPDGPDEFVVIDRYKTRGQTSIRTPNLPISVEVEGPGEAYVGGRQYGVYGKLNPRRRLVGEERPTQTVGTTGLTPLISARVRLGDPWVDIPLQFAGGDVITDQNLYIYVILGATINNDGDANWEISQYSTGDTSTEFNLASTTMSGGEIIGGPWLLKAGGGGPSPTSDRSIEVPRQDIPIGVPVTFAAKAVSSEATVISTIRMAEIR